MVHTKPHRSKEFVEENQYLEFSDTLLHLACLLRYLCTAPFAALPPAAWLLACWVLDVLLLVFQMTLRVLAHCFQDFIFQALASNSCDFRCGCGRF